MPITVSLYNHTAKLFADGSNSSTDTYDVMLCTAATFNAANTTLASVTKTEVTNANGYTTGGKPLTNVTVSINGNDAIWDADDLSWTATGSGITASYAIIYNDTDPNDPPLAFIDFGGSQTALAGSELRLVWSNSGIFSFQVT